jgi:hypothetical protein
MSSPYDLPGLYQFLTQTPEQGLRKMFVDGKPMTDVHFSLLLKVLRSGQEADFCAHAEKTDFPKVKFSPNETKMKEKFWADCFATFQSRGILNPSSAKAA